MAKPKKNKTHTNEKVSTDAIFTELEKRLLSYEQDQMLDDHGFTIVGSREKAPVHGEQK